MAKKLKCGFCGTVKEAKTNTAIDYIKYGGSAGGWLYGSVTDQPAISGACFVIFFLIMISAATGNYSDLNETKQSCSNKKCPSHKLFK